MIITGAKVYTEDHIFEDRDIYVSEGRIVSSGCGGPIIDGKGLLAIPGLVDIHFHGAKGHDICEGNIEALEAVTEYEAKKGILAVCPATMTLPKEDTKAVLKTLASYENEDGACIAGINLEGPFVNPEKSGAQDPADVIPFDKELLEEYQELAKGRIKLVDLAPECMPDMDEIR